MSAAQLSATTTARAELTLEASVAARIIRSAHVPCGLLQWLASPSHAQPLPAVEIEHLCDLQLTEVLQEIAGPVGNSAPPSQQRQARGTAQWLAVACRCSIEHSTRLQLAIGPRLLAASLLPLYRSLATGGHSDGLRQTQLRLGETLSLWALCDQVGPALVEVIDTLNTRLDSPHALLTDQFNLSLPLIAQLLREIKTDFDFTTAQFGTAARQQLQGFDASLSSLDTPAWAAPELVWKLAGELTAATPELQLPHSLSDVPLPWNQIVDHWHEVMELLTDPRPPALSAHIQNDSPTADEEHTLATVDEMARILSVNRLRAVDAPKDHSAASISPPSTAEQGPVKRNVVISEILTHSDPCFVKVIRRQIGKCRAEDRAVSLVSLVVLPEDAGHRVAVCENGLNMWQQKLVEWLSDHPQIFEPHAFLTASGELLLCILDLERNETTALLRHGLIEVLTGRSFDRSQGNSLAEVDTPVRYHAGIASNSSIAASFLPEQLIGPSINCLTAARRHGKASIKSIEVY